MSTVNGNETVIGDLTVTENMTVNGNTVITGNFGGNISHTGDFNTQSMTVAGTITGGGVVTFNNPTDANFTDTAAVEIEGGVHIKKKQKIFDTTASTSLTTGALVVAGGIGVSGNSTLSYLDVKKTSNNTGDTTIANFLNTNDTQNDQNGINIGVDRGGSDQVYSTISSVHTGNRATDLLFTTSTGPEAIFTPTLKMALKSNGNLGIGVREPTEKFDVSGTAKISGNVGIGVNPNAFNKLYVNGSAHVNNGHFGFYEPIGPLFPSYVLHAEVSNPGSTQYPLLLQNNTSALSSGVGLQFSCNQFKETTANITSRRIALDDYSFVLNSRVSESVFSSDLLVLRKNNVGIGTTSPSEKLEVIGNAKISGITETSNTQAGAITYPLKVTNRNGSVGTGVGIEFIADGGIVTGLISNTKYGSNGVFDLKLQSYNQGALTPNHLVLRNSNVGIGIDNPTACLHIVKNEVGANTPLLKLTNVFNLNGGQAQIDFGVKINEGSDIHCSIICTHPGNRESDMSFQTGPGGISFTKATAMTIKGSGNVGIGTETPTAKLDVIGNAKISGSLTTGSITINNSGIFENGGYLNIDPNTPGGVNGVRIYDNLLVTGNITANSFTTASLTNTGDLTIAGNLTVSKVGVNSCVFGDSTTASAHSIVLKSASGTFDLGIAQNAGNFFSNAGAGTSFIRSTEGICIGSGSNAAALAIDTANNVELTGNLNVKGQCLALNRTIKVFNGAGINLSPLNLFAGVIYRTNFETNAFMSDTLPSAAAFTAAGLKVNTCFEFTIFNETPYPLVMNCGANTARVSGINTTDTQFTIDAQNGRRLLFSYYNKVNVGEIWRYRYI